MLNPPTPMPLSRIALICVLNFDRLIMAAMFFVESLPSTVACVVRSPSMKLPPRKIVPMINTFPVLNLKNGPSSMPMTRSSVRNVFRMRE